MADVSTAPAAAAPAKEANKKVSKPKRAGPSIGELIVKVVAASKERSGVSFAFLKQALSARGYDVEKQGTRVKTAIKTLVIKGTLLQTKGSGASGSFKINKIAVTRAKKSAKKSAAAKKRKAAAAKESAKKVKRPAAAKK